MSQAAAEQEQLLDQQQQRELEASANNAAMQQQQAEEIRDNLLNFLTESDLQEGTKDLLRNYASKSFILGYLKEEEVSELKWDLRITHQLYLAEHPGTESEVVGEDRAFINDDPRDRLKPLNGEQKLQLATFFQGIWTNVTRARGMKQQEIMKTQIARSEVDRADDSNDSGGLIDRLRGS